MALSRFLPLVLTAGAALVLAACHSLPPDPTSGYRTELTGVLTPLVPGQLPELQTGEGSFAAYWKRFDPEGPRIPWSWSLNKGTGRDTAVLVLGPADPRKARGIVLFFHGYLSHSGNFMPLFRFLHQSGWWVVATDLPGHGLSGPLERGNIDRFSSYGTMVEDTLAWVNSVPDFAGLEKVAVGHSTGGASLLIHQQAHPDAFSRLVLSAPLIRSWMYGPSLFGAWLAAPFASYLGSAESGDPLGVPYVPLGWFRALAEWNSELEGYLPRETPLLLLTGNRDRVVETDHNVAVVSRLYPHLKLAVLDGLDHAVLQREEYRTRVFGELAAFLAPAGP